MTKRVLVLGSTGSVGQQALDVLSGARDSFRVVGLSAHSSADLLASQAAAHAPVAVCLVEERPVSVPAGCQVLHGADGLVELVRRTEPDVVIGAITGAAGLASTLESARSGAHLALANKESLVLAGDLVKAACARSGSELLPVDSEHSAIAQCLAGASHGGVRRLVLTASGGPFRGRTREDMADVTIEQALNHPSWEMGPRITIDSATLMNKALEIVEACHLFDVGADSIEVVVHPQSVIHSMVEFVDGSIVAQLGPPDMRVPIRWALAWPQRMESGHPPVDVASLGQLTFEEPDREAFPCLDLGVRVAREGGLSGCVLNAANEIAVDAFLAGRLPFLAIPTVVTDAMDTFGHPSAPDLETILEMDGRVRRYAEERLLALAR